MSWGGSWGEDTGGQRLSHLGPLQSLGLKAWLLAARAGDWVSPPAPEFDLCQVHEFRNSSSDSPAQGAMSLGAPIAVRPHTKDQKPCFCPESGKRELLQMTKPQPPTVSLDL